MSQTLEGHLASNVNQIAERRSLNDRLGTPREVEHFAHFSKRRQADAACAELETRGFVCTVTRMGIGKIDLVATTVADVTPETTDRLSTVVFTIVASNGGNYDGWGGTVLAD